MKTNYAPGQILYIQSTDNYFYLSVLRSMQQHPVVDDANRYEINTCCDLCVDIYYGGEMHPDTITFARGSNASTWDVNIEFVEVRPAHDFEKKLLFDKLVDKFKLYDPKWTHLTDSTFYDIRDWLCWQFDVDINLLPNDSTLTTTIYEITNYIWNILCKETGNYQENTVKPEMVNKEEFIDKTINYFTPILKTYCSEECVKELIDGFVNSLK